MTIPLLTLRAGNRGISCAAAICAGSHAIAQLLMSVCVLAAIAPAHAPSYPTKPIRLVVGSAPGGPIDFSARLVAQGIEPVGNSPEEFAKLLRTELPKWAQIVKISGARVD